MFTLNKQRGFQVTFANGITVSVQFGSFSYCANYDRPREDDSPLQSPDAEVAVFGAPGQPWLTKKCWRAVFRKVIGDSVVGYCTPEEVSRVMHWAAKQPTVMVLSI